MLVVPPVKERQLLRSVRGIIRAVEIEHEVGRGLGGAGYRTVFNCNAQAGQTVFHAHLHLLGGRTMAWRPG